MGHVSEGNIEEPSAKKADLQAMSEAVALMQRAVATLRTVDLRRYRQVPRVRTLLWDLRRSATRTESQFVATQDALADAVERLDGA
jgi:hypothetical protein